MTSIAALFEAATRVRRHAHVPYCRFPVSAAIRTAAGTIHVGVNIDNAAYPLASCAEANAIGSMVAAGERDIVDVLIIGGAAGDGALCTPCGGCRQRLAEFGSAETRVHVCGPEGIRRHFTLGDLLPYGFSLGKSC